MLLIQGGVKLGLLDFLYEHRYLIAYEIGLIDEIPIAVCSDNYETSAALHLHDIVVDQPICHFLFNTIEVKWIMTVDSQVINPLRKVFYSFSKTRYQVFIYPKPTLLVFHPPA